MRVGRKIGEYFSKKSFNLLSLYIYRADGSLENPSVKKDKNTFMVKNELWKENKKELSMKTDFPISELKRILGNVFDDLKNKEYKKICLSQAGGIVFIDLWEK